MMNDPQDLHHRGNDEKLDGHGQVPDAPPPDAAVDASPAQPPTCPDASAPATPAGDYIDWKEKFLRAKADFQNLQRRALEEQRAAVRYAHADFARALVEVLDDFERTLEARPVELEDDPVMAGVRLIYSKLSKILKDHRVELIESLGRPFEPRLHEALMQQSCADQPPGTVIREVQKGYRLHDRVLRPARVIVAKAADETHAENSHCDAAT